MRTRIIGTLLHDAFLLVGQMRLDGSRMRRDVVGIAAVIAVLLMPPAWADYAAGQEAWEAGRIAEALSEWEAAAAEGDVRAMMTLGRAYRRGAGVPQDYILAHFWFNLAASHDNIRAVAERDSLAELMTVEEQAEARKQLRDWRNKMPPTSEVEAEVEVPDPAPSAAVPDIGPPPPRAIKEAQSLLAQLGYSPGPADGIWGRRTSEAYRAFLGDADLPADESLTPETLHILREIAARQGDAEQPEQTARTQRPAETLHRAAKTGDLDGLNASLEAGADVNARDKQSWTALMHVANKGYTLLVPALLEANADPDVQAADGATALFMAAVHGHSEIIVLLMNAGADFSIKGPTDRTAADVARVKYGGLHAAQRNNERAEVLALMQEGQPISGELEESIERSKLKLKETLLKCEHSHGFRTSDGSSFNTRNFYPILDVEFAGNEMRVVEGNISIYGEEYESEALIRGRYRWITTYVIDIKSVSISVNRNSSSDTRPFDDGYVIPSHHIVFEPVLSSSFLEDKEAYFASPSSGKFSYRYRKGSITWDLVTSCTKDDAESIAKEFSNIQNLLGNL